MPMTTAATASAAPEAFIRRRSGISFIGYCNPFLAQRNTQAQTGGADGRVRRWDSVVSSAPTPGECPYTASALRRRIAGTPQICDSVRATRRDPCACAKSCRGRERGWAELRLRSTLREPYLDRSDTW